MGEIYLLQSQGRLSEAILIQYLWKSEVHSKRSVNVNYHYHQHHQMQSIQQTCILTSVIDEKVRSPPCTVSEPDLISKCTSQEKWIPTLCTKSEGRGTHLAQLSFAANSVSSPPSSSSPSRQGTRPLRPGEGFLNTDRNVPVQITPTTLCRQNSLYLFLLSVS